ncbi:hypothetical protein MGYG_07521 [Nannizzia gypsea CBS 118893]|uniref:PIN domain-containing protein n=1 Tax=Arthroderma gypseum (strain ATCC MYA-4604 / CBS 118893) TaxID=535722 RepID=E4V3E0_ARTGP|nr:hypothetical protein MGYG_07521 [Nannizzia gypsea CBS 118893]EFR04514.1 hypothetical protein MGYG_07521 [Nannizzia gypsea CBS 118893]
MSVGRKVFHCVVDETCLTTNLGEIKKWTSQDAIGLIVPLYTLERLHIIKKGGSQSSINACEAVRFLDRVTSGKHNISAEKVTLQGPMEQFSTWGEAEKYILPEFKEEVPATPAHGTVESTLKEEKSTAGDAQPKTPSTREINDISQMLLSKLNFKKEKEPSSTSAASAGTSSGPASPTSGGSRASPECSSRQLENNASSGEAATNNDEDPGASVKYVAPAVPNVLKPLLNAVLWRLHALPAISTPQSSCILVTNDRETQIWAQKFGIIVKNIAQLRTSIIYEEKEFKNHCKYLEKNQNQNQIQTPAEPKPLLSYEDESDEDVLVFVPRKQGKVGPQTPARTPVKNTPGRGNKTVGNNPVGTGRPRASSTAAETPLEIPSAPIDPDSFSRSIGMTKQNVSPNGNPSPTPANRGTSNANPRPNGNRRGGARGGGFRGAARGRGKLWVP